MVEYYLLSACCFLLLPRQFHVTIVENRDEFDVRTAAWLVPVYLVAINVFVVPLAIAGRLIFADGSIDRDMTVLALPFEAHSGVVTLLAMIGGMSAATAMVMVELVALAIMVSNDLVMPLVLRGRSAWRRNAPEFGAPVQEGDLGDLVLIIRRVAIVLILCLGYVYFKRSSEAALATIGLLSFAAITQIAPAFLGGLVWRAPMRAAPWPGSSPARSSGPTRCSCPRSPIRRRRSPRSLPTGRSALRC